MNAMHAGVAVGLEDDIIVIEVPRADAEELVTHLRRGGIYAIPRYDSPDTASLLVVSTLGLDEVEAALEGWEVERR
jgi:hypothetical protein